MSLLSIFARPPHSPPPDSGHQIDHDTPTLTERDDRLQHQIEHTNVVAAPQPAPLSPAPPGRLARLFRGLTALAQPIMQATHWLFPAYQGGALAAPEPHTDFFSPVLQQSRYRRHCTEAQTLANEIRQALRELDVQLREINPDHTPIMPPTLQPEPTLTWRHTAERWNHRTRALTTAATSSLGQGAIAAGIPYATSLGTPSLLASMTSVLGAGYLCGRTLQNFPRHLNHETAARAIRQTMAAIRTPQIKLERLLQEEIIRKNAMERVATVLAERTQHIRQLENKFTALVAALDTASSVPAAQTDALPPPPEIGDGQQRRRTCAILARTQRAFNALFSSLSAAVCCAGHHVVAPVGPACRAIGHGLSRAGQTFQHILDIPGILLEQRTASRAEFAYQNGAGKTLIQALTAPTDDSSSIVNASYRAARDHYRDACGFAPPQAEIRNQLYMGERIVHALMHSAEPTPGVVAFEHQGEPMTAPANLTTVRALAWYFDAAADIAETTRPPSIPVVQRLPDQHLLIADPEGRFYDFLMQAPTAYTLGMVDTAAQNDPTKAGVFQLHDHCAGFPRGNRGVQFERVLDKTTDAFALYMRLQPARGASSIAPATIVLRDADHVANRACAALPVNQTNPSILATDDYLNMSQEELNTALEFVVAELERYVRLAQGEHQQLQRLENWNNPDFQHRIA